MGDSCEMGKRVARAAKKKQKIKWLTHANYCERADETPNGIVIAPGIESAGACGGHQGSGDLTLIFRTKRRR